MNRPLHEYGWNERLEGLFSPYAARGLAAGRVTSDLGPILRLATAAGPLDGVPPGRLRQRDADPAQRPAVGDWVAFRPPETPGASALVEAVLPRTGKLSRKAAGERSVEQVVAANVDTVFVVMGLDGDYSPRRIERFLVMAWESGAAPVVVLNKADLCPDAEARRAEIADASPEVPVELLSCATGQGLEAIERHLRPGATVVLVGSSGVGKSTLINRLLGAEVAKTGAVREDDDQGKHTTTHRELYLLPGGALLVDNPGVRELAPWASEAGLADAFDDIAALAGDCRFRDCGHGEEPGCAVRAAVDRGALPAARRESFLALGRELAALDRRRDKAAQAAENRRWKVIHKAARKFKPRG